MPQPSLSITSKPPIGLDLGELSMKAVWIDSRGILQASAELPVEPGVYERGIIRDPTAARGVLTALLAKLRIPGRVSEVTVRIPESKGFLKIIELPRGLKPKEIGPTVRDEIQHHFPVKKDEVVFDWQIAPIQKPESELVSVLIAAAPRSVVEGVVSFLEGSGLRVRGVSIETVAAANALQPVEAPWQPSILADLGASRTSLALVAFGTLAMSVSVPLSGELITREVAAALGTGKDEAEKQKISCGLDERACPKAYPAIESLFAELARSISELSAWSQRAYGERPKKVILSGGGALTKKLPEYLLEKTGLPAEVGNPLVNIKSTAKNEVIGEPIRFATAVGLALSGAAFGH